MSEYVRVRHFYCESYSVLLLLKFTGECALIKCLSTFDLFWKNVVRQVVDMKISMISIQINNS